MHACVHVLVCVAHPCASCIYPLHVLMLASCVCRSGKSVRSARWSGRGMDGMGWNVMSMNALVCVYRSSSINIPCHVMSCDALATPRWMFVVRVCPSSHVCIPCHRVPPPLPSVRVHSPVPSHSPPSPPHTQTCYVTCTHHSNNTSPHVNRSGSVQRISIDTHG